MASASTKNTTALAPLRYNGVEVHAEFERLSLTDMWKAAGSDPSKQPAKWREQEATKEFVAHLSSSVLLQEEDKLFSTKRGASAGTWAHWQIALSYARYLSPQFHALCNVWCRERMEGHSGHALSIADDERAKNVIGNMIKNCSGVAIRDALSVAIPHMIDEVVRKIAVDGRNIATGNVSIREILDQMRVPSRKRRKLQGRIYARLRTHCLLKGIGAVRCVRTKTWLWPVVEATAFIRDGCGDLIREHRDMIERQGQLKLVPKEP